MVLFLFLVEVAIGIGRKVRLGHMSYRGTRGCGSQISHSTICLISRRQVYVGMGDAARGVVLNLWALAVAVGFVLGGSVAVLEEAQGVSLS